MEDTIGRNETSLSKSENPDTLKEITVCMNAYAEFTEMKDTSPLINLSQEPLGVADSRESINLATNSKEAIRSAIKKSSLDFSEDLLLPQKRAIKKSSISPINFESITDYTNIYTPIFVIKKIQATDRILKLQKSEKETKTVRSLRNGEYQDKLSTLLKMKERFSSKQNIMHRADNRADTQSSMENLKNLYQFKSDIQKFTGICDKEVLEKLELRLKEFLRINCVGRVNCYDFAHNRVMTEAFGCGEIRYNDLAKFVSDHVIEQ